MSVRVKVSFTNLVTSGAIKEYAMYFSCKCNVSKILALVVTLKFHR